MAVESVSKRDVLMAEIERLRAQLAALEQEQAPIALPADQPAHVPRSRPARFRYPHHPTPTAILSPQFRVLSCNQQLADLLAIPPAQLLETSFDQYVTPASWRDIEALLTAALHASSHPSCFEVTVHLRPADDLRSVEARLSAAPLITPQGPALAVSLVAQPQASAEDIDDAVAHSLLNLIKHASIGVLIGDMAGKISYANPALLESLGYSEDDVAAGLLRWDTLTPPEGAARDAQAVHEILTTGHCQPYEKQYLARDGRRVPILLNAALVDQVVDGTPLVAAFTIDLSATRRAEQLRHESEQRLQIAFEAAGMGWWDWDMIADRITWSEGMNKMVGVSPSDFGNTLQGALSLVHPDDRARVVAAIEVATRERTDYECEVRIPHPDGSVRWNLTKGHVLYDENGRAVRMAGVDQDITARKQVEEALRQSEQEFRILFDLAGVGKALADPHSGRYLRVNHKMCEFLGYSCEEMLALTIREVTHPEDAGRENDELAHVLAGTSDQYILQKRFVRKDGQIVWGEVAATVIRDAAGRPQSVIKVIVDISKRKQVEAELAREHAIAELERSRLRAVLDILPMGVVIADNTGEIFSINPAARTLWNESGNIRDARRILRARCGATSKPLSAEDWGIGRALQRGEECLAEEIEVELQPGRWCTLLTYAVPIRGWTGPIVGAVEVSVDFTHRKQVLEQIRALNETLEQRVAERTQVAEERARQLCGLASKLTQAEQSERRRIATDLHDHLAQLLVATRMKAGLVQRIVESDKAVTWLQEIDGLLQDALQYTRTLIAELSPTVLHESGLLGGLQWLAEQMRQRHNLQVEVIMEGNAADLPNEQIELVYQAVRELLFNVVKHAGVTSAQVRLHTGDEALTVAVCDEGAGCDAAALAARVQTGKYGLFSVRERLEALGGHFSLESQPGHGSRATLVVPLHALKSPADGPCEDAPQHSRAALPDTPSVLDSPFLRRATQPRSASRLIRVLLVDDHLAMRRVLSKILMHEGNLEVVGEATNGVEAVEMAWSLRPDVIIMDLNMPVMDGVDATRRIHSALPDTAIIGLSAADDPHRMDSIKAAGAFECVNKSGPPDELARVIRSAASRQQQGTLPHAPDLP